MAYLRCVSAAAAWLLLFHSAWAEGCKVMRAADLELRRVGNHLVTPIQIDGSKLNMILDTGSIQTIVSRTAADRLKLDYSARHAEFSGIGGYRNQFSFKARTFQMGRLRGRNLPISVIDSDFSTADERVDGVIGADFLSQYDVDLDLPDGKAILFNVLPGCNTPGALLEGPLYSAPMRRGTDPLECRPLIFVSIGGQTLRGLLDTGAPNTSISRAAARGLGLRDTDLAADPRAMVHGIGPNVIEAIRHRMDSVGVGEIALTYLPVNIIDQPRDDWVDVIVGMDFINRVHMWFGYASRTVLMQTPPLPSPRAAP